MSIDPTKPFKLRVPFMVGQTRLEAGNYQPDEIPEEILKEIPDKYLEALPSQDDEAAPKTAKPPRGASAQFADAPASSEPEAK